MDDNVDLGCGNSESTSLVGNVLYPGRFDPPTLGHLNVLAKCLDKGYGKRAIVYMQNDADAHYLVDRYNAERLFKLNLSSIGLDGVDVDAWTDCRHVITKHHIGGIVRGIRGRADIGHERGFPLRVSQKWQLARCPRVWWIRTRSEVSATSVRDLIFGTHGSLSQLTVMVGLECAVVIEQARSLARPLRGDVQSIREFNEALSSQLAPYLS